jgi:homoserine acetyltransferase
VSCQPSRCCLGTMLSLAYEELNDPSYRRRSDCNLFGFRLRCVTCPVRRSHRREETFELPSYTTVAGETIKSVKIGWQAAGTVNVDKSNAILITHYFTGTSHAFGKYAPADKIAGYWDAIIGPGKAIDTNKYYVLSSDTLGHLEPCRFSPRDWLPVRIDSYFRV